MPAIDRAAIFARDSGLCGFCGEPVPERFHLDHVRPKGLGGPTTPDNLRVAHRACNISAGREVRAERKRLGLGPSGLMFMRAPAELHERLTQYAESRGRPLNRQLLYWLAWLIDEAEAGRDPKP